MPEMAEDEPSRLPEPVRAGLFAGDKKIAGLLGLGIIALLVTIAAATLIMFRIADDTRMVEHTLIVQGTINRMNALNERVETARRGYILDHNGSFRTTVEKSSQSLRTELGTLRRLIADNPVELRRTAAISELVGERQRLLDEMFASGAASALPRAASFDNDRGVEIVRRIRVLIQDMLRTETRLLNERDRTQLASLVMLYVVGGTSLALLIGVLGTVIFLILRYNRSLTVAQELLQRANAGLETAVAKRTAELQRANQEIQRFAYIVSHDLRSPLVNVLGFTAELDESRKTLRGFLEELFEEQPERRDEAVWQAVDEDLPEALRFIRTSTERMDRLINSILHLSRQGRRQLVPEMLDLDALMAGVIGSLHQRAHDAGATVTASRLPSLESDRMAVEQILSNLTENAIKYLDPARPGEIRIEGRRNGRLVEIDVIDNGRGIAPDDHERIFELFRRSGAQDQPGEGIGLAHVRALAYRLGGWVEVESELDRGARFRLSLPAKFVATEQGHE